jgi:hypothetical protein
MQRLSRLYVSHFGSATAWYNQLLFNLDDPETDEPTDVVFNLENAGGKTSLLAFIFSCFDPKQERWLQHLQKRSHRFAEYFARDGRPAFLVMEWRMPARLPSATDYRLIVGQAVTVRESTERGADIDRWFFSYAVTQELSLESLPLPGFATSPVRTMHDFVQWMFQAAKRSKGDFFHTKTQEDWVRHLGNARLLDIELLRMQVDFNSNEGGMEEGFLTFNTELDLLRRFLVLTLDGSKCATVRDAVAQTADKLRQKPKFERRLTQLNRLQGVMLPFAEAASRYTQAREAHQVGRRTLAGLAKALTHRRQLSLESAEQSRAHARAQQDVAQTSTKASSLLRDENLLLEGMLLERRVASAKETKDRAAKTLSQARYRKRCLEGARAWVHVEATRARRGELEALYESEKEGLKPARQHAEIQGALLRSALKQAEQATQTRKEQEGQKELTAKGQIDGVLQERSCIEKVLQEFSSEQGQLDLFMRSYAQRREQLIRDQVLSVDDPNAQSAIERLSLLLEKRKFELESVKENEERLRESERSERDLAAAAALDARDAKAAQEPHRISLAKGESLREELRESSLLRTAADTADPDPDAPPITDALNRLISDAHREIADRNVRLAQLDLDRTSILETGLAGRSPNVDAVVRALQTAGVRSARAANTYLADVRPDAVEARSLVTSDPARFLGVTVAQGEWSEVTALVNTLRLRLTAPVKVAVSSVEPGAGSSKELVLPAQDDSAYNKPAAQSLRSELDTRINDTQEECKAYEYRRDQGEIVRERLSTYLRDYGATRLHQARTAIEELELKKEAAIHRQSLRLENADKLREQSSQLRDRMRELPAQIVGLETDIRRLREFQIELESDFDSKSARLATVRALFSQHQARIEELDQTRQKLEEAKECAMERRLRLGQEADALRREVRQIVHYDAQYPADEQLLARPRGIETLRVTYSDAATTLQTQERDRLGLLAERLAVARTEHTTASEKFENGFSGLPIDVLEPLKSLDFDVDLPSQETVIEDADKADRAAEREFATVQTEHRGFWSGKTKPVPRPELTEVTDASARDRISVNAQEIRRLEQLATRATEEAQRATTQANDAHSVAEKLQTLYKALTAAVPVAGAEPIAVVLPEDFETYTTASISEFQKETEGLEKLQASAAKSFRAVTVCAGSAELAEVEPELSHELAQGEFEIACADRERIVSLIADRIRATQDTLEGMQPDFENCVGEIYNLTHEAIRLLGRACAITMPTKAPYVGGKAILKMKAVFNAIAVEARKVSIRHHLNSLIDTGVVPAKGADLIANAVVAISGRPDLGVELLKMEQNEAYQYQLASNLKGSKGQGSVIAMFLYLLISQLRADMQARAKRTGGGPLILDNPFAKVQTRALVDAQRLLAKEIGVQLIFFTANADYNMLSGFRRVIRLRKAGAHSKSGRSHIEMVSATFSDLPETNEAAMS